MTTLDPRIAALFAADRRRRRRALVRPVAMGLAALALALYLRAWPMWVGFGVVVVLAGVPLLALSLVGAGVTRMRAGLEADVRALTWLHSAATEPGARQVVELRTRDGASAYLVAATDIALAAVEAARALPHRPTVTTTADDRAVAEPCHHLAAKLDEVEQAARLAVAPDLSHLRPVAQRALAAWRTALFAPTDGPLRPSARWADLPRDVLETRLDRLLVLYRAASMMEGHRAKMAQVAASKGLPSGIIDREAYTDEIRVLLVQLPP